MENSIMGTCIQLIKKNWQKVFKFGITGGLGTCTNLLLFFICTDKLGFPDIIMNVSCFLVAGTQNYFINHRWTFRQESSEKASLKQWFAFMTASVGGYLVNITIYIMLTHMRHWPYKVIPQAFGILGGMAVNFLCSNFLVFKPKA